MASKPHYNERASAHVRKAYKDKGDDTTLSRWVKVKHGDRKFSDPPRQAWSKDMRNPSMIAGRSLFFRKGVKKPSELKNLLVSAHNNAKIGRDVRRGKFKGYWIYTLSLEERATCPRSCTHWETCYGNNMPYAKRVDHTAPDFLPRLEAEIAALCDTSARGTLRKGVLIRLHALGDFYSTQYVEFWGRMLVRHRNLAIYGYTAQLTGPVMHMIRETRQAFGTRFSVRWSDGGLSMNCTASIQRREDKPDDAFLCPEQSPGFTATGKPILCATCGLCWSTRKNVAFLEH